MYDTTGVSYKSMVNGSMASSASYLQLGTVVPVLAAAVGQNLDLDVHLHGRIKQNRGTV